MVTRTAGWYAERPRAFDEAVREWNGREIDRHLDSEDGEQGTTLEELDAEIAWWKMLEEIEPDERTSR